MTIIKDINDNNLNEMCGNAKCCENEKNMHCTKVPGIGYNIVMENMGGIANQMAEALQKMGKNLYAVGNRTHQ